MSAFRMYLTGLVPKHAIIENYVYNTSKRAYKSKKNGGDKVVEVMNEHKICRRSSASNFIMH